MRFHRHVAILSVILVLLDYSTSKSTDRKVKNQVRDDDENIIKSDGGNTSLAGVKNYELNEVRGNGTLTEPKVLLKRPKKTLKDRFKNPIFGIIFSNYKIQTKDNNFKNATNYSIKFDEKKMPQLKPNETTQLLTSDTELKTRKKYEFKNTSRSAKVAHQTVLSTRFGSSKNGNFSKNVKPTSNVTAPATKKIIPSLKNITRFSTLRSSNCLSHYMLCNPGSKVRNGGCCYGMICVKTSFANICLYYGWDYTRARKEHSDDILHYERVHKKTMKPRKKARKTKVMKE